MIGKDIIIAVLATFCLTTILFTVVPVGSYGTYDPWLDYNDDGKIDARDVAPVNAIYGSKGTNITKAYLAYDSGWLNITDKIGQDVIITHGLNRTDLMVDITGKMTEDGEPHQKHLGLTAFIPGWNESYTGSSSDTPRSWNSIAQTNDGGYVLAGTAVYQTYPGYTYDFRLTKISANGIVRWDQHYGYGPYSDEQATSVIKTSDQGYLVVGGGANPGDCYVVKTDANGNRQWDNHYGGLGEDWAMSAIQAGDGGYVITGWSTSFGSGDANAYLFKIDGTGSLKWSKNYGGSEEDKAFSVVQADDGGYVMGGYTGSSGAGNLDFWLAKTDANGDMEWNKTYGTTGYEEAHSLVHTSDGGYALAGDTNSLGAGGYDFWLIKTDESGNMQWNKTYGGSDFDRAYSLIQTDDGGYALTGYTGYPSNMDFWLVKTSPSGEMQWTKMYGGTDADNARSLLQAGDGSYVLAGYKGNDAWVVKTDVELGLVMVALAANTCTLYRGTTDPYWNYVRVQMWQRR